MNSNGRFSGDLTPATLNGSQHLINGAGLDWLQEIWDETNQILYYQMAIGNGNAKTTSDHDIWRLPQAEDTYGGCTYQYRYICHRPVFVNTAALNSSGQIQTGALISPNLAGRLAADFALCYHVYKTSEPTYADQCLLSAEHIFDLANRIPAESCSPRRPSASIRRRNSAMTWSGARRSFTLPCKPAACPLGCLTPILAITSSKQRTGPTNTSQAQMTLRILLIFMTSVDLHTSSSTAR